MKHIEASIDFLILAKVNAEVAKYETQDDDRRERYMKIAKDYALRALSELNQATSTDRAN